ncbi:MAG: hypothetical protein ACKO32_16325 [Planctomycetia bacterium]
MLLALMLCLLQDPPALADWSSQRTDLSAATVSVRQQWLAACLKAGDDPALRAAALEIYAQIGGRAHLRPVLEWLAEDPTAQARTAVHSICARDPEGVETLLAIASHSVALRPQACVLAVELGGPASTAEPRAEAHLISMLAEPESQLCGELLLLSGHWQVQAAVPRLVELMDAESSGLRRDAHWSLRQITGLGLQPRAEDWRVWFDREQQWWHERLSPTLAALDADDPLVQQRGLRELGERHWRRAELRPALEQFLTRADEPRARQAEALLLRWEESQRKKVPDSRPARRVRPRCHS